jgi:hypothetical protein
MQTSLAHAALDCQPFWFARSTMMPNINLRRFFSYRMSLPPNPSLNSDVPYAGLRPRNGPPVSLFR